MNEIKDNLASIAEALGWSCGVEDSIRIIKWRKQFLKSLGPAATPKPGVIEILDEVIDLLEAMRSRGHYATHTPLSTAGGK